jgi:hypothetical protein
MYVSIITLLVYLDLYHRILGIAIVYTIGLYPYMSPEYRNYAAMR